MKCSSRVLRSPLRNLEGNKPTRPRSWNSGFFKPFLHRLHRSCPGALWSRPEEIRFWDPKISIHMSSGIPAMSIFPRIGPGCFPYSLSHPPTKRQTPLDYLSNALPVLGQFKSWWAISRFSWPCGILTLPPITSGGPWNRGSVTAVFTIPPKTETEAIAASAWNDYDARVAELADALSLGRKI